MKFSEVASRLNGVSTPVFGLSWNPPRSDVTAAREVVAFLEDRRALYNPYEVEVPEQVIQSILGMRRYLTQSLSAGGLSADFVASLRTLRAACRKFLDRNGVRGEGETLQLPPTAFGVAHMHDIEFNQSLGELRGVVGVEVAKIATSNGLDVEEGLASILPAPDTE